VPQEKILWVTHRRQHRTGINRQRFEDDQSRRRQDGHAVQSEGQRDDDEQRNIVGQDGRQCGRGADQQQGQMALGVHAREHVISGMLQEAALFEPGGEQQQAGQCGDGRSPDA
jgi:hypothetical protein